jgi:hypothetical protein
MTGLISATIEVGAATEATRVDAQVMLPCVPTSPGMLRGVIRALAGDFPRLDDVLLIASELVTCAIRTRPAGDITANVVVGEHGARVTVALDLDRAPTRTRVTAVDTGFGWATVVVQGTADICHHDTVGDRAETTAEVKW